MPESQISTPKRVKNPLKRDPTTPISPQMERAALKRKLDTKNGNFMNYRALELRYQRDTLSMNLQLKQAKDLIKFLELEQQYSC